MTTPYAPQQPPKRLTRSTSNKFLGGVCGGVADYLNMDANLVRILTVVVTLFTGVPIILYLVALFLLPEDRTVQPYPPSVQAPAPTDTVWGQQGPPWAQQQSQPEPVPAPAPAAPTPAADEGPTSQSPTSTAEAAPDPARESDQERRDLR